MGADARVGALSNAPRGMNRRSALIALACALGGAAAPPRSRAAAALHAGVVAWGPEGCWVAAGGDALHRLPDAPARGIDPVPTALGLWLVTSTGTLRRWDADADADAAAPWLLRCTVRFDAPVHALAASPDGRWALTAHGEQLSLVDGRGEVARTFDGIDLKREPRGAASALFSLPQRRSFFAAWPALGESWEISLDPAAAPIFDGLVHDYRMGEGLPKPGYLGARRAPLGRPMPAFSFADERVPWVAGMLGDEVVVVHLDVRRRIAALRVPGADPAGAALRPAARGQGSSQWWLPAGNEILVLDATRWERVAGHVLPGPVRQLQATDEAVWALVGERGAAALYRLGDSQAGAWQAVGGEAVRLAMLRAAPRRSLVLALRSTEPAALLLFDAGGSVLRTWPLPTGTGFEAAAWLSSG